MRDVGYLDYQFSSKRLRMRKADIMALMASTYWAKHKKWKEIKKSIQHSIPFGIFDKEGRQVGFARVLTDFSTTFYLADVVVQEELRGAGLGKAFLQYLLDDPRFRNVKGILLTRDAQGFYEQFGFVRSGERCMLREWDKNQG